jgi:pimeloyl-ACP methyl ester carboxylesterase
MDSDTQATDRVTTAVVLADGLATTYRRSGSGPTVVLLGADAAAPTLARSYRVITPEVPPLLDGTPEGSARWLSGVLDGLGIEAAVIVATPATAAAVALFAEGAPDRVKGVIVTTGVEADLSTAVARCFG